MLIRLLTAAVLLLTPILASAQTVAPIPMPTFHGATGTVCNGCLLYTYSAGTSTALSTFQDTALGTPHTNPIVLSATGKPPAPIYLSPTSYKFILTTALGATIWSADSISAVPSNVSGVSSSTDIIFQVDTDSNGTNVFSFLGGTGIQKAVVEEDGDAQFDGNVTVGDGTENDKAVLLDGATQDFHAGIDDSVDSFIIGRGTALGTTPAFTLTSAGAITLTGVVTFPSQAVFSGGATFAGHLIATDATYDIGASGATRFRDFFLSRNAVIGGTATITGNSTFGGTLGITGVTTLTGGAPALLLTSDAPATPVARTSYRDSMVSAWAKITNDGTAAIADDFNVASIVRNGTGDVTVTFATAIASANYAVMVAVFHASNELTSFRVTSATTAAVRIITDTFDDSTDAAAAADMDFSVTVIGE